MNSSIFCVAVKIVPKPETARCWEHCWYRPTGIDLIKWKLHCCSLSVREAVYIACTLWRRAAQSRARRMYTGNSFQQLQSTNNANVIIEHILIFFSLFFLLTSSFFAMIVCYAVGILCFILYLCHAMYNFIVNLSPDRK